MDGLSVDDLWEKDAYNESGERLGRIEAVALGRDRVPVRVGVRSDGGASTLKYFSVAGARLFGGRVVIATAPPLDVVAGGTD